MERCWVKPILTVAYNKVVAPGTVGIRIVPLPSAERRTALLTSIPIIAGEVTEVLVTVWRSQAAHVQVEHHPDIGRKVEASKLNTKDLGPTGTITGRFMSPDQRFVAGVQIFVRGRPETASSNRDGAFTFKVPAGTHGISFIRSAYRTSRRDAVTVTANEVMKLGDIVLQPSNPSMEDYVVSVPYIEGGIAGLVSEQRDTSNVVETLGAEQMARSGDSDAASALTRVTGLTIMGGRYIYVRGMGDRYSATRLNGLFLPSPEPERRVVPLDLFPTGILSAVVVQKTFSPDQPGEFGGGVVQMRTRGLPEKSFFSASISSGYRMDTTFEETKAYPGGDLDWLGMDDGTRALPAAVRRAVDDTSLRTCSLALTENCLSFEELGEVGRAFPEGWDRSGILVPPDVGASISAGYVRSFGANKFGGVASLSYGQNWQAVERENNMFRITNDVITKAMEGRLPN